MSLVISSNINQIPDIPYFDDKTYLGFEYGSAGISIALLEAYSLQNMDNTTKEQLLNIATDSLENLWDARIEYEGIKYPTWKKAIEEQYLSVYPGLKYGAPGIIRAFLKIFEITNDVKWLNRAEDAYWYLSTQAINASTTPHWPYHYAIPKEEAGIAITDLKYGSTGILSLSIELFQVTKKQQYLDHGKLIISWFNEIYLEMVEDGIKYNVIPWYALDGSDGLKLPFYTTYGFGLAGIAPNLYQFGIQSQSNKDKDWAMELGRYLVAIQLDDGSWFSISDSLSDINLGLDNGVAGILEGLFELKLLSNSNEFDSAILGGMNWLFSRYFSNSTHVGFYDYLDENPYNSDIEITNSLYDGSIGILRTLSKLKIFLTENQLDLLAHNYQWIITLGSFLITNSGDELLFLMESPENYQVVDFSYAQGLAGWLSELVNLGLDTIISGRINFNLTRAIVAAINTFDYFQQSNGHWQRQYLIPSGWTIDHFTIANISNIEIPITPSHSQIDTSIKNNDERKRNGYLEGYYYFISLATLLSIILIFKRKKINK